MRAYRHVRYLRENIYAWCICAKRMGISRDLTGLIAKELYVVNHYFDGEESNDFYLLLVYKNLDKWRYMFTDCYLYVVPLILFLMWNRNDFSLAIGLDVWRNFDEKLKKEGSLTKVKANKLYTYGTNRLFIIRKAPRFHLDLVIESDENAKAYDRYYDGYCHTSVIVYNMTPQLRDMAEYENSLGDPDILLF